MQTLPGTLYDYPKYYDLLFGSDWRAEYHFLLGCFEKHARRPVKRLFEPACGTGRLLVKLARAGYEVSGLDLNSKAVAFCNQRLERHGLAPTAFVGDMTDFRLKRRADAAFNTINSFRHLASEALAEAHLRAVAQSLAKGGLYVLGFHLTPTGPLQCEEETWSAQRGHLAIGSHMWSIALDRRKRQERVGFTVNVYTPTASYRIEEEMRFRTYTARQFAALLEKVESLELAATYDFAYDLRQPVTVTGSTEDVVYVLRKR